MIIPGSGPAYPSPTIKSPDFTSANCGSPELRDGPSDVDADLDLITSETAPQEVMEEHIRMLVEELSKSKVCHEWKSPASYVNWKDIEG